MTAITIGSAAPSFSLPADGGRDVSLHDFSGASVVLFFYPKDDTSGCTKEALAFKELLEQFDLLNTVILGISKDSVKSHDKYKAKYELPFTLLSDESTDIHQAYDVWKEKSMYGKTYMGAERSTFLIDPQGKVAQIWRKVKVPGHAEAVLEEARTLQQIISRDAG